ncbi:MAG: hypothetical protein K6E36_01175 [Oscillospiraceae bacterium]|nr:hypothetical protein [Oscillospiraceae bacterium]
MNPRKITLVRGTVLAVFGAFLLLAGLFAGESAAPDLNAFDVLLIVPMLVKLVLAELSGVVGKILGSALLLAGITDLAVNIAAVRKYGWPSKNGRLSDAKIAEKLDRLYSDLKCGYLSESEYEREKQKLLSRSEENLFD